MVQQSYSVYISKGHKIIILKSYLHSMFTAVLFTIAKIWKQSSVHRCMNVLYTYFIYIYTHLYMVYKMK